MNKFKESIQLENFIREEQKKIRVDPTLSNIQKKDKLEALEMVLRDYKELHNNQTYKCNNRDDTERIR